VDAYTMSTGAVPRDRLVSGGAQQMTLRLGAMRTGASGVEVGLVATDSRQRCRQGSGHRQCSVEQELHSGHLWPSTNRCYVPIIPVQGGLDNTDTLTWAQDIFPSQAPTCSRGGAEPCMNRWQEHLYLSMTMGKVRSTCRQSPTMCVQ
jgi:hypothetical protein